MKISGVKARHQASPFLIPELLWLQFMMWGQKVFLQEDAGPRFLIPGKSAANYISSYLLISIVKNTSDL